jgi:hypothetical protein
MTSATSALADERRDSLQRRIRWLVASTIAYTWSRP